MNILIASFSFPSMKHNIHDGRFVFSEAMAYGQNGARVTVITPHFPGVDKKEEITEKTRVLRFQYFIPKSLQVLKKPGVPIYDQKSLLAVFQIPILCLCFALDILKHARWADIIHAQWTITALLALPAKWIWRKKIVLTARGSDLRLLPKWINRFIHSRVDAAIDCFGPQPRNIAYKKTFPAKYLTMPLIVHNDARGEMPQDMRTVLNRKLDEFIVLYVGRFDPIKIRDKFPLITLILGSKILKASNMNFHVFYVGDGDEIIKNRMLRLINEYELHNYVTLLGPKTNVFDYIQFSHLGVGGFAFNGVSQEFTISARAQILVGVKDNLDTPWRHGTNCIFVRADNERDLANKLIWAMKNPAGVRTIGMNAKEQMSKYIVDSAVGGMVYLREFQKVIEQK
jgi:glycosyltransferase involved in cell wall biosynthesis